MRCLGCPRVVRSRTKRAQCWNDYQLCPKCFDELVPDFYAKCISNRIKMYNR